MTASAIVALLMDVSVRAVLVTTLVGAAVMVWRVRGGAARHVAWTGVMAAMLLMPVLLGVVPEWRLPLPVPQFVAQMPEADLAAGRPDIAGGGQAGVVRTAKAAPDQPSATTVAAPVAGPRGVYTERTDAGSDRWEQAVVAVWLAGLAMNMILMVLGWRLSRRLVSTARISEVDPLVLESPAVSAPCAVGVWRARIVVPHRWRTWSRAGREAALQHERAHVHRHDLFVSFIARVNRAVFWFHPLAWWLERRIAAAAEQACDEVVLRAGHDPRRYAALLVDLAAATRASGARVAWQSLGMAQGGALESRLDRVLTGEVPRLSRPRAVGLAVVSTAAVMLAVGCRQAPPPLAPDPDVTADAQAYQVREDKWKAAQAMSLDGANALAARFTAGELAEFADPAQALLTFYMSNGQTLMGWNGMVAARRAVLLTLIERHPESPLTHWPLVPRLDREGWSQARSLWMSQVAKTDASATVLGNAAGFFSRTDPELAETLLLRAMALDPDGPQPRIVAGRYFQSWHNRLAGLYAEVLVGATDENVFSPLSSFDAALAQRPMAQRLRRDLETSADGRMVAQVGQHLVSWFQHRQPSPAPRIGFDPVELGLRYLRRGLTLAADQPSAQIVLARYERHQDEMRTYAEADGLLGQPYFEATPEAVLALPADLQLALLPELAARAGARGDRALARRYCETAFALAGNTPEYDAARFAAGLVLAHVAMADGDRRTAVRHLRDATRLAAATTHPLSLEMNSPLSLVSLPYALLDAGEYEVVADFYEAIAARMPDPAATYQAAADAIRAGRMPANYQRYVWRTISARTPPSPS